MLSGDRTQLSHWSSLRPGPVKTETIGAQSEMKIKSGADDELNPPEQNIVGAGGTPRGASPQALIRAMGAHRQNRRAKAQSGPHQSHRGEPQAWCGHSRLSRKGRSGLCSAMGAVSGHKISFAPYGGASCLGIPGASGSAWRPF